MVLLSTFCEGKLVLLLQENRTPFEANISDGLDICCIARSWGSTLGWSVAHGLQLVEKTNALSDKVINYSEKRWMCVNDR